jgi:hypothetical protein
MKRLIFALCGALLLTTLGPLPVVSAHNWWWHHHSRSSPSPAGVGADNNAKRTKSSKARHEKGRRADSAALYTSPKTVGWWHKSPGPMGAGSGSSSGSKTQSAHRDKHHKHNFFAWFHHHDANPGATGATGK